MITMNLLICASVLAIAVVVLMELGKRDYTKWLESQQDYTASYG